MTGLKKRTRGTAETESQKKCLTIFVSTENGYLLYLGVKSLTHGCQNIKYGHFLTHSGSVYPIKNCNRGLEIAERNISNKLTIHIKVKSRKMKLVLSINKNSYVEFLNGNFDGYKLKNISAECCVNNFKGFAVLDQWSSFKGDGIKRPDPILRQSKVENIPLCLVTSIGSEESKNLELTGGKGNSLSLMKGLQNDDISISEVFIVTTQTFNKQIETNFHLRKAVSLLEDIALERERGDLKNACEATVELFHEYPITPTVAQEVIVELMKFRRKHDDKVIPYLRWAVRSSAIGEDSEESSAAGQNDTFLGSQTDKDVLTKIYKCWGSLFSYQSLMYRRKNKKKQQTKKYLQIQRHLTEESHPIAYMNLIILVHFYARWFYSDNSRNK